MPVAVSSGSVSFGDGFAAFTGTRPTGVTERAAQRVARVHNRPHELQELDGGGTMVADRGFKLRPGPIWDPANTPWDVIPPGTLMPASGVWPSMKIKGGGVSMLGSDPATWGPIDHGGAGESYEAVHQEFKDLAHHHAPFIAAHMNTGGGLPQLTRKYIGDPHNYKKLFELDPNKSPSEALLDKALNAEAVAKRLGVTCGPLLQKGVNFVKHHAMKLPNHVDKIYKDYCLNRDARSEEEDEH